MDSMAISCLLKQADKDNIIASKTRELESKTRENEDCNDVVVSQAEELTEVKTKNTKLAKKAPRNFKIGGIIGFVVGLATQIFF
jgi:hypothetical protein